MSPPAGGADLTSQKGGTLVSCLKPPRQQTPRGACRLSPPGGRVQCAWRGEGDDLRGLERLSTGWHAAPMYNDESGFCVT